MNIKLKQMTNQIIKILDNIIQTYPKLNIDSKVNHVYRNYDIDWKLSDEIREYFKMNIWE